MPSKPRNRGASGLGLAHLQGAERAAERLSEPRTGVPIGQAESRRRRERGKRGEREVVQLWRAAGWTQAMRQPGSGNLRGMGGEVVLPGDVRGVLPWAPVEVKYDARATAPSRGWPGEAFVRATLKRTLSEWRASSGPGLGTKPCAWFRIPTPGIKLTDRWRVYVPSWAFLGPLGSLDLHDEADSLSWVELTPGEFFELLAPSPDRV